MAGPTVRVATQNVWNAPHDVVAMCTAIRDMAPTLAALQEITHDHARRIEETGVFDEFGFREVRPHEGHAGLGVWSRVPLESGEWVEVAGEVQLRAWLHPSEGPAIRLYVVHAPSPIPANVTRWKEWFRAMEADIAEEVRGSDHPLIALGDFNATVDHSGFRRLLRAGLTDAAMGSRGLPQMTWPLRWSNIPPLFRVDHVLFGGGFDVASLCVGEGHGSDHRPVIAELRLAGNKVPAGGNGSDQNGW